jgi:hypothetical protein
MTLKWMTLLKQETDSELAALCSTNLLYMQSSAIINLGGRHCQSRLAQHKAPHINKDQHFPNYVPQNTGILQDINTCSMEKTPFIKFEFSIYHHSSRYYSYRIFINTFHLVTKISCCSNFYMINEGPKHTCSLNIDCVNVRALINCLQTWQIR